MAEKKRILFVDDEPSILDALRRALRGQRDVWNMCFAQSVDEALEKAHAMSFDAVVTDVTMPGRGWRETRETVAPPGSACGADKAD